MNPKNNAEIFLKFFANEESTPVTLQEHDLAEKIRFMLLSGVAFEDTTELCFKNNDDQYDNLINFNSAYPEDNDSVCEDSLSTGRLKITAYDLAS